MYETIQRVSVRFDESIKFLVKRMEKTIMESFFIQIVIFRQQHRAQRRRQGQRDKGGNPYGNSNRQRELLVQYAHNAAHKSNRYEYRDQNNRDADNRPLNFFHRKNRCFPRRFMIVAHFILDRFHNDDRVVDNETDRKHHREKRQRIDRKT